MTDHAAIVQALARLRSGAQVAERLEPFELDRAVRKVSTVFDFQKCGDRKRNTS